jgi:hypothetical protein
MQQPRLRRKTSKAVRIADGLSAFGRASLFCAILGWVSRIGLIDLWNGRRMVGLSGRF